MEIFGIDVSSYQGKIDFKKVKESGKDFVILRSSLKNKSKDACLDTYYKDAKAAGLKVGVYKYVYATNVSEAIQEATLTLKYINYMKLDLGVWIDMEDKSLSKLSSLALKHIIDAEAKIFKSAGFEVGVYCNKNWYDKILKAKEYLTSYPFWIARYPVLDTGIYKKDSSLSLVQFSKVWQYSQKGRVDGITTHVDLDVILSDDIFDTSHVIDIAKPTLRRARNNDKSQVKLLQQHLNDLGFAGKDQKSLTVDGIFGENVEYALKRFQLKFKDCGSPDGIYGKKSYAVMLKLIERS
mgnify:CR=1 FL=1